MALVLVCQDFDSNASACLQEMWVEQPGLLPPLPVDQGLVISGAMITACAIAWSLKAVRRFIWPRA